FFLPVSFSLCAEPPLSPSFHPHSFVERFTLGARRTYNSAVSEVKKDILDETRSSRLFTRVLLCSGRFCGAGCGPLRETGRRPHRQDARGPSDCLRLKWHHYGFWRDCIGHCAEG